MKMDQGDALPLRPQTLGQSVSEIKKQNKTNLQEVMPQQHFSLPGLLCWGWQLEESKPNFHRTCKG